MSQKVPTFKLSVSLSNLNQFSKFLHCYKKPMKFATKFMQHYPPHLKHVATLPCEIKHSNFLQIFSRYGKMHQIAFLSLLTLLFIHKFWYFRCLRYRVFPILIANKILLVTVFFCLFTLRSVCGSGNSSQQTSLRCLSTINMAFSYEDQILTKTHKFTQHTLSLIHIWRCRRIERCRSRWSPYH